MCSEHIRTIVIVAWHSTRRCSKIRHEILVTISGDTADENLESTDKGASISRELYIIIDEIEFIRVCHHLYIPHEAMYTVRVFDDLQVCDLAGKHTSA